MSAEAAAGTTDPRQNMRQVLTAGSAGAGAAKRGARHATYLLHGLLQSGAACLSCSSLARRVPARAVAGVPRGWLCVHAASRSSGAGRQPRRRRPAGWEGPGHLNRHVNGTSDMGLLKFAGGEGCLPLQRRSARIQPAEPPPCRSVDVLAQTAHLVPARGTRAAARSGTNLRVRLPEVGRVRGTHACTRAHSSHWWFAAHAALSTP